MLHKGNKRKPRYVATHVKRQWNTRAERKEIELETQKIAQQPPREREVRGRERDAEEGRKTNTILK